MGKFTEFNLPLKSMPEGTREFNFQLGQQFFSNMECEDVHGADIQAHVTVTNRHGLYELSMAVTGTVTLLCDRCLGELLIPLEAGYDISVKYGQEFSDESDSLLVIPQTDNFLNIAYMLKDTVMLALPMRHIHPLGKCDRAMAAVLRKHRASAPQDQEEEELEETLLEEIDSMEASEPNDNNQ